MTEPKQEVKSFLTFLKDTFVNLFNKAFAFGLSRLKAGISRRASRISKKMDK
jgi:hypothetical protein